jgi:hypothetical protein
MGEIYDIGVRVGSQSDDAALQHFNENLGKVLRESASLSESLRTLSKSFGDTEEKAEKGGQKLKETGEKAKTAKGDFLGLKDGILELGKSLLALVALEKLREWLFRGAEGAEKEDRALRQVSETAKRWGLDGDAAAATAKDLADAMLQLGIDEQDTYKSFREFIDITHDLSEAQSATALSAQIAAAKDISYGEAQEIIIGLIQGRKMALKDAQRLGVEGAKDEQDALDKLREAYGHYSETLDDAIVQKQKFKAEMDNVAEEISGPVQKGMLLLIDLFHGIILGVQQLGAWSIKSFQTMEVAAGSAFEFLSQLDWKHPLSGTGKAATAARAFFKEQMKGIEADYKSTMDELDAEAERKWGQKGAKLPETTKIRTHKVDKGEGAAAEAKAQSALAKATLDLASAETAEAQAAFDAAESKKTVQDSAQETIGALERQRDAERALVEAQGREAVAAAKKTGVDLATIKAATAQALLAVDKKYEVAAVKVAQDAAQKIRKITLDLYAVEVKSQADALHKMEKETERWLKSLLKTNDLLKKGFKSLTAWEVLNHRQELLEMLRDEKTSAGDKLRIEAELANGKIRIQLATAAAIADILSESIDTQSAAGKAMFVFSKGLNAAMGMMNAWEAAIEAMKNGDGYTAALRFATVLAIGLKAVADIRAVTAPEPASKGFDNPEHDALAYLGGRRWAEDWVRLTSDGFASRLKDLSGSGPRQVYDQSIHTTKNGPRVSINASISAFTRRHGEAAVEDLARRVDHATPAVLRLRLSRPRIKRGSARRLTP